MLAFELYELFGYVPRPELLRCDECEKKDEGIWDVLGYYVPRMEIVVLCESKIEGEIGELRERLKKFGLDLNERETWLALRELVRLHEHSHALIHVCDFYGFSAPNREWYVNLSPSVNEPLTEFVAWSILQHIKDMVLMRVFEAVDAKSPTFYHNWKEIKDILVSKGVKESDQFEWVPPMIKLAREEEWRTFQEFKRGVEEHWDEISKMHNEEWTPTWVAWKVRK